MYSTDWQAGGPLHAPPLTINSLAFDGLPSRFEYITKIIDLAPAMIRNFNGSILFSTGAISRLYGWSPDEMRGRRDYELLQTEFPKLRDEIHADLLRLGVWSGHLKQTRRDGSVVWVASSWMLMLPDDAAATVVQFDHDITNWMGGRQESCPDDTFRALADDSSDGVGRLDGNLRFLYANVALAQVFGSLPEVMVGKTGAEVGIPERERSAWERQILHVFETGEPLHAEQVIARSGRHTKFDVRYLPERSPDGAVNSVVVISRDISGRSPAARAPSGSFLLLQALHEHTAAPMVIKDRCGRILTANAAALLSSCKSLEEVIGRTEAEIYPGRTDAAAVMETEQLLMETGSSAVSERTIEWQGQTRTILTSKSPVHNEFGEVTGLLCISTDISDRKRMERGFSNHENTPSLLSEKNPDAIVRLNADLRILYANAAAARYSRTTADVMIGKALDELDFPEHLVNLWKHVMRSVIETGTPQVLEFSLPASEETIYFEARYFPEFESGGSVQSLLVIGREVTRRKRAEIRERSRAAELQAIMDAVPAAILITSDPEGREVFGNEMAYKLLRVPRAPDDSIYTREQSLPLHFHAVKNGVEINPLDLPVRRSARTRQPVRDAEFQVVFENGEKISLVGNAVPLFSEGMPRGAVGAFIDVTELRAKERLLEESRDRMRVLTERLLTAQDDEKRRIAQDLHDDLSQKLAVTAFEVLNLAVGPQPQPDALRDRLRALHERVTKISEDVRNLAYELHPSVVDDLGISAALQGLCEEFAEMEGIEVNFSERGNLGSVPPGIASCLYRVAQQALQNVSRHARARSATVSVTVLRNTIQLTIEDTGIGFNRDRAKFGIGLLSMEQRVRQVNGTFRIESRPAAGTSIVVRIPIMPAGERL